MIPQVQGFGQPQWLVGLQLETGAGTGWFLVRKNLTLPAAFDGFPYSNKGIAHANN